MANSIKIIEDRFNCKIETNSISGILGYLEGSSIDGNDLGERYQSKELKDLN